MRTFLHLSLLLALTLALSACGGDSGEEARAESDASAHSGGTYRGPSGAGADRTGEGIASDSPAASQSGSAAPTAGTEASASEDSQEESAGSAPNRAPVMAAFPPLRIHEGDTLIHHFAAADPDTDELEYFLHPLPPHSRLDRRSGRLIVRRPLEPGDSHGGIVGVRDSSGSEIARPLAILWDADPTPLSDSLDDARTGPESGDIPWPTGRTWLHALQVQGEGLQWPLRWVLTGRTPAGLELDRDTGILRWAAPDRYLGEATEIGVRVTDAGGRTLERNLRILVDAWEREALPAQHLARGESLLLDWSDGSAAACTLRDSAPLDASAGDCTQTVDAAPDAQRGYRRAWARLELGSRTVERELGLWIHDADCDSSEARDLSGSLTTVPPDAPHVEDALFCPGSLPLARDLEIAPLDTDGWIEFELRNRTNAWSDLDMALSCPEAGLQLRSTQRSPQLHIATPLAAGIACTLSVTSRRPLTRTTSVTLTFRSSDGPACSPFEGEGRTLSSSELLAERLCPGETRSWKVPEDAEPHDLVSRDSQIDALLVAIAPDQGERLLRYIVGRGQDERIEPPHDTLREGEELVLRLRAHDVPIEGGEFLLRPISRNRSAH